MNKELRPCPWCGHAAKMWEEMEECTFRPICPNSSCYVQPFGQAHETKDEAIEAWNKRAD